MATRRLAALFLATAIAITLPAIALAASNSPTGLGLVPCGVSSNKDVATECQACNLVELIQNLITFLIAISVPIAMAMFAYAGFLYFTSGVGGTENISKAKKIFSSSAIGFALAITSWLIVNTVLNTVLDSSQYPNSSWFKIDCSHAERPTNTDIGTVIASHLGWAPEVTPQVAPTLGCNPGFILQDGDCKKPSTGEIQAPTIVNKSGSGAAALCSSSNCSPFALRSSGFDAKSSAIMSCVALTENGGRTTGCNGNACGTFQIMLTQNSLSGEACKQFNNGNPTLDCKALCKGSNGVAVTTDACRPCYLASQNAACNAQSAAAIYSQAGAKPWLDTSVGGYSDNKNSVACVNKYAN